MLNIWKSGRNLVKNFIKENSLVIITGAIIGLVASLFQSMGNPANMGICVACFTRDTAGALGLHHASAVQYVRPEIIGLILGAFLSSWFGNEHKARGSSQGVLRFFFGLFAMLGALVFLGCSWRVLLRIAGGDGTAILGLVGLIVGIAVGSFFIKSGYSLSKQSAQNGIFGKIIPAFALVLLVSLLVKPAYIFFSQTGPGSMHVNVWLGLAGGLLVGALAQRSRFCTVGAFRNIFLINHYGLFSGVVSLLACAFLANLVLGQFHPGLEDQPIAHANHVWNFLSMLLAGLAFTLGGGCPGRQLILAGEGDTDAGMFFLGMLVGAGFAHRFATASSPAGVAAYGPMAVGCGILYCFIVAIFLRKKYP
jgi:YedE family putative selenium metabolism protein